MWMYLCPFFQYVFGFRLSSHHSAGAEAVPPVGWQVQGLSAVVSCCLCLVSDTVEPCSAKVVLKEGPVTHAEVHHTLLLTCGASRVPDPSPLWYPPGRSIHKTLSALPKFSQYHHPANVLTYRSAFHRTRSCVSSSMDDMFVCACFQTRCLETTRLPLLPVKNKCPVRHIRLYDPLKTVARLTISCISVRLLCLVQKTACLLWMKRIAAMVLAHAPTR